MRNYYRLMLGRKSSHAAECFAGNFVGVDYGIEQDLSDKLYEQWRDFNHEMIPVYLASHPDKTRIGAGLACGALWTVIAGMQHGDQVLCPDGEGNYRVGQICGDYVYAAGQSLPHRRPVLWLAESIARGDMSEALARSTAVPLTVVGPNAFTVYREEIERLLGATASGRTLAVPAADVEDPYAFALEKHLEDFLVANWEQTALGREFDIVVEDGERVGQQYQTGAGPIDILAISHDRTRLLVVELKRGRASDVVVGQILRYMGYLKGEIAEAGQSVEGAIIALEDDQKLRWALAAVQGVQFYRYQMSFSLVKG
ncbi:MAG: DUF91 domain-containing protein [Proteobacteria bacterium]|nr:DUF91 domain-containing protein [Pseudomonadota bacterium]